MFDPTISLDSSIFRQVFDLSPEAVVLLDRTGRIVSINDRIKDWLGYDKDEIVGKRILSLPFLSLKSKEIIIKNFLKRIAGGKVEDYVIEFLTKQDKVVIGRIKGNVIKNEDGHIIGEVVMVSEITQEFYKAKRIEKRDQILEAVNFVAKYFLKSKAFNQDFEVVIEKIGQSCGADRVLLDLNDLNGKRYVWQHEAIRSKLAVTAFPNIFRQGAELKPFRTLLESDKIVVENADTTSTNSKNIFTEHKIKSLIIIPIFVKRKFWAALYLQNLSEMRSVDQTELDALKLAADILGAAIEKNNLEIELRETVEYWKHEKEKVSLEVQNTRRFRQAVESATDGVMMTTTDHSIVYVNPAWVKMMEYSSEFAQMKSKSLIDVGQTPSESNRHLWENLSANKPFVSDAIVMRKKNESSFPVQLSVFPIGEGEKAQFFVWVLEDISKRKEIDKMKTDFISIASHQLNTPLSAMKWFLELLLNGKAGKLSEKQTDFVQNIAGSNLRMIELVRSLLNITRIESGRIIIDPKRVEISTLLDSVIQELSPQLQKKQQEVKLKIDNVPKVRLDPKLIRQVYGNLLSNASKYSPEKSKISISIYIKDDQVISHIKDFGYGIPKDVQHSLFTRFFRAPNVVKLDADGSGLGLYLVKIIIDSSGGKIWYKSNAGKGADFWFSLPLAGVKAKQGEVTLDDRIAPAELNMKAVR